MPVVCTLIRSLPAVATEVLWPSFDGFDPISFKGPLQGMAASCNVLLCRLCWRRWSSSRSYALKRLAAPVIKRWDDDLPPRPLHPVLAVVANELFREGRWYDIKHGGKYPRRRLRHGQDPIPVRDLDERLSAAATAAGSRNPAATTRAYSRILRLCTKLRALRDGMRVHDHIIDHGYWHVPLLRNLAMAMYASCGALRTAARMFKDSMLKNRFSYNGLIAAAVAAGHLPLARRIFDEMHFPDRRSWCLMVTAHAAAGDANGAAGYLRRATTAFGLADSHYVAAHAVVAAYAAAGKLREAKATFDAMPRHFVASWNALAAGYVVNGYGGAAVAAIQRMRQWNGLALAGLVVAYAVSGMVTEASLALQRCLPGGPTVVAANAVVAVYAVGGGDLVAARRAFDSIETKSDGSWETMLLAYASRGFLVQARELFNQIPLTERSLGIELAMIRAYVDNWRLAEAREIFDMEEDREGELYAEMVTAYARSGDLQQAKRMFDESPSEDATSWDALINAYAEVGDVEQVEAMAELRPEEFVVAAAARITAYCRRGDLDAAETVFYASPENEVTSGAMVQGYIVGCTSSDEATQRAASLFNGLRARGGVGVWNALIEAYTAAGLVCEASRVVDRMPRQGTLAWNALLRCYVCSHRPAEAMAKFRCMELDGITPDKLSVLLALDAGRMMKDGQVLRLLRSAVIEEGMQYDALLAGALIL